MNGETNPAGFLREVPFIDHVGDPFALFRCDPEQKMSIRPGTDTTAADLDAEPVIQQFDDQVIMNVFKIERKQAQTIDYR